MKKIVFLIVFSLFSLFASEQVEVESVDCVILEDENSIICKYVQDRVDFEKKVTIQWIDPENELSRSREMLIPAGHGSVYDFRYIDGRKKGIWTFKVIDQDKAYEAKFELK
ncbi:hypothetical protein [Malaciobacter mytili]|uniref:DUF2914 domain-containing protein n=1 Tax=Malaciobacter mytili LMG 24559 TaxID=1032238 RepID=A0AAX2AH13_9BACT|nr:hypothetical protein [Malaciobacter mytili]AXH15724.1 hypothetical protein AMYT_2178 [Malaciobacter mytili LMG 24559]RXI38955.1 hypothetical protein CRU99_11060 [Malaciobacter mytili]RXK15454.1 hypothetical protein CP985_08805 [Malaciobacter mytili LMG 24559]